MYGVRSEFGFILKYVDIQLTGTIFFKRLAFAPRVSMFHVSF